MNQTSCRYALFAILSIALMTSHASARVLVSPTSPLPAPRLSTGDVDGDGRSDMGLITDTQRGQDAQIQWFARPGEPAHSTLSLTAAVDLAHADIDGDGADELLVVDDRSMRVIRVIDGALSSQLTLPLAPDIRRIAAGNVGGDEAVELILIRVQRDALNERPRSTAQLVRVGRERGDLVLDIVDEWHVDAHVGDVCFVPDGPTGPCFLVETGVEEVGGRLVPLQATSMGLKPGDPLVLADRTRILSLHAARVGPQILVTGTDVAGRVRMSRWLGTELRLIEQPVSIGSASALAGDESPGLWIAPRTALEPLVWTGL